jgi:selT/selW/selH-like putative selenoprotein
VRLSNGIFKVYVDDEKIFDKHESGRFPEDQEILRSIEARNGA